MKINPSFLKNLSPEFFKKINICSAPGRNKYSFDVSSLRAVSHSPIPLKNKTCNDEKNEIIHDLLSYIEYPKSVSFKKHAESHDGIFTPFNQCDLIEYNKIRFLSQIDKIFSEKSEQNAILTKRGVCEVLALKYLSEGSDVFFRDIVSSNSWEEITQLNIMKNAERHKKLTPYGHLVVVISENEKELNQFIRNFSENDKKVISLAEKNIKKENERFIKGSVEKCVKDNVYLTDFIKIIVKNNTETGKDNPEIIKLAKKLSIENDDEKINKIIEHLYNNKNLISDFVTNVIKEEIFQSTNVIAEAVEYCKNNYEEIWKLLDHYEKLNGKTALDELIDSKMYNGINRKKYTNVRLDYMAAKLGEEYELTSSGDFPSNDGKHILILTTKDGIGAHAVGIVIDKENKIFQFFEPNFGEASFADINDMKKFFLTYTDDYDVNNFTVDTYKPRWAV